MVSFLSKSTVPSVTFGDFPSASCSFSHEAEVIMSKAYYSGGPTNGSAEYEADLEHCQTHFCASAESMSTLKEIDACTDPIRKQLYIAATDKEHSGLKERGTVRNMSQAAVKAACRKFGRKKKGNFLTYQLKNR
jgi:hypothetical protein